MACNALASITDELRQRGDSLYQECAFIWIAPRKLHEQSYGSMKGIFGETRKLNPVMFDELDQSQGIQPGEILFVNWESINKEINRLGRGDEKTASIFEIARMTQEDFGLPVVAVIDEEHMHWDKTADKSKKVLDRIDPALEIRISATPKTPINGTTQKVLVDRKDVIEAEMIKKEVVLNPDIDIDAAEQMSLENRLLKAALKKRQQIADEYRRLGVTINPLLLIQLPNDKKDMSKDDNEILEIVTTYLKHNTTEEITVENEKLAVWLANRKDNLEDIEKPDRLTKVLLFKEAIALGWDCPRAAVLLIFRKMNSDQFTIQTVGRIMRMPEQRHYTSELLNIGYVYTDLAKDKIKIVAADQNYIHDHTVTATRKAELINVSLPSVYDSRPNTMHNYLGPDFKIVLYRTAEELFGLTPLPGLPSLEELAKKGRASDSGPSETETELPDPAENCRRVRSFLKLDVKDVEVTVPKDVHFQNKEQEITVGQARFARTNSEIERVFLSYINEKGHQFESRRGDRTMRIAGYLLCLLEDYLEIYGTDARKLVLHEHNKPYFDRLLDLSLERYFELRKSKKPKTGRTLSSYDWEVPEERVYDSRTHNLKSEVRIHALNPFYELEESRTPERAFVTFLEKHSDKIEWWYKNGDKGKIHYAIPYSTDDASREPLFYPDFIIRMRSGRVYVFDTKTIESEIAASFKHNALLRYIGRENTKGQDLRGGIIINKPAGSDVWLYSTKEIDNTHDLEGWIMFDPWNA